MLIDKASQRISIIDWGETSIGNPFLSLALCLERTAHLYNMSHEGEAYKKLQILFFEGWGLSDLKLQKALAAARPLAELYYVFTLQNLMKCTGHNFPNWNGRIKNAVMAFCNS